MELNKRFVLSLGLWWLCVRSSVLIEFTRKFSVLNTLIWYSIYRKNTMQPIVRNGNVERTTTSKEKKTHFIVLLFFHYIHCHGSRLTWHMSTYVAQRATIMYVFHVVYGLWKITAQRAQRSIARLSHVWLRRINGWNNIYHSNNR